MADLRPAARVPLLVLGMLSLLGGVLAGLARLDWHMPPVAAGAAGWHGALMISAFLGTVISLERAVALGRGWAYAAPAAAGIGGIALLAGAPLVVTQVLTVVAASILLAASMPGPVPRWWRPSPSSSPSAPCAGWSATRPGSRAAH
jgi:hypothetical protein